MTILTPPVAPRKGIQDAYGLAFWISRRGFRIPGTGFWCFQWNMDSGFQ